jgi:Flp pilus assembly protein TadD
MQQDLRMAIACLDADIAKRPAHWQAFWVRGKALQALGEHPQARDSFARAYAIEASDPNVGRELMMELIENGELAEAVRVSGEVSSRHPADAGLRANHALALVLAGDVPGAQRAIQEALRLDSSDPVSRALSARIDAIARNERPRPRTLQDLER